uniref:fibronectin-like isoform X1 n=1 Tax=Myxine glutinosa TaxID=7769 RepID=UPI00358EC556
MKPKGHRESRFHGSMQGFLRLLLIQITVFFASSCALSPVPCGGEVQAEGSLASPGYPQSIYSSIDCVWDIEAPAGHVVLLTVVELHYDIYTIPTDCRWGWLAVGFKKTSQRNVTMCHYLDAGRTIISPSNTMRLFYKKMSYYGTSSFNVTLSSRIFDTCIPQDLKITSFNSTSATLTWIVLKDKNNMFSSFVSLFSSGNKTQNYTTTNKELTITGLSPGSNYSVSISSMCDGTESIASTAIAVQTNPAPPLNVVVERDFPFFYVSWTAPNGPNKDHYTYYVKWYLKKHFSTVTNVDKTDYTIAGVLPGKNYTVNVYSSYNNKYSEPATITFTAVPCGGKVRAEGWLSSPGYPQYIYSNTDCVWDIEAPLGHVVFLTVVDLNSSYILSSQCNWAWLAVGYNRTSQRDITMCQRSDIGRTIVSPSNTLRVFYQTTSSYNRMRRFNVTLSSQDGCVPAQLKVVSYSPTSVTLSWIVPNDLNNTHLSFVSLLSSGKEIQNHRTKSKELTITGLSPITEYSVSISSLCKGTESIRATIDVQTGPSPPMNLEVVEQDVGFAFVRWTAPNDPNKDNYTYHVTWYQSEYSMNSTTVHGAEINITSLTPGENYTLTVTSSYNNKYSQPATITFTAEKCGGDLLAEGSLVSPGFPFSYQNNMDCVWDVRAPDGQVVVLNVVNLHLEDPYNCRNDWLGVAYTNTMQREITMCQPQNIGRIITSSSNFMRIFFHSDGSVTGRGFNITLSAQDGCVPAQLKVVSYSPTSVSLTWIVPNDLNNTHLSFVSLFSSGDKIQNHTTKNKELTITGLSTFAEYNVSISSLCNGTESIPATIDVQTGPSPPMNLEVVEQGVGFAFVRWTAPNDPNKDNYTYHVTWYQSEYSMISTTMHGAEINITSLTLGENYTLTVTSSYNNKTSIPATITFTAEKCGGNLLADGWFVSPGFPLCYENKMDCVWDVRAPDEHVVVLTVMDLDLGYNPNCQYDWLGLAYTNTTQREITMCEAKNIGRIITSSSNFMRIFFHSDWIHTARGFNITLSAQDGCIPIQLKVVSYSPTSVSLTWIVPNDVNNTHLSFVSLFSSGNKIQNHTTKNKELTIAGLSPFAEYNVSISSLCDGTESIPATIDVQTGPSPPMNLAVVEEGFGFASLRWAAPHDPNKDSYRYLVKWYQNVNSMASSETAQNITGKNITRLTPARNYTVSVTSSYNSKSSLPTTITFTTVPCVVNVPAEGWLASPDDRHNIDSNTDCVWTIEAPVDRVVVLTVVDLNYYYYYSSSQCYENWLAVGYNQTSDRDVTMCRYSDVGRRIISPSNTSWLYYRKTSNANGVHFNVTLSSQESCNVEKCQKRCTGIDCKNDGTCSCDDICTVSCNCRAAYKGNTCDLGADIVAAVLRQDAPKVEFDMTVRFHLPGLNTSQQETMLREQFQNLSGFNQVSVSPLKEGTTNDYPVKAKFNYTNDNINKVYNGRLKDEIAKTFPARVRSASQENITLIGDISQQNVPMEDLDEVFQCNTKYDGYIVSFNNTKAFCKSPCTDPSYCNNRGNCTHLQTGAMCSCDPHCKDKKDQSTFFKILFGVLGGVLGVVILLGIVHHFVKRRSPSKSHTSPKNDC